MSFSGLWCIQKENGQIRDSGVKVGGNWEVHSTFVPNSKCDSKKANLANVSQKWVGSSFNISPKILKRLKKGQHSGDYLCKSQFLDALASLKPVVSLADWSNLEC